MFTPTVLITQGRPQSAFEVYADETKEQTVAFCFTEDDAKQIASLFKRLRKRKRAKQKENRDV